MEKSFSVSPRILSHLGADLIKNESIALLELAKNAYDACASACDVKFVSQNGKITEIHITDNGFGMTRETIENVYLTIGTDHKLGVKEPNRCGRLPLGEKGIGRLGIHKLGTDIHLISKSKNDSEVHLVIDWKKLSDAKEIDDFKINVYENRSSKTFGTKTGTKIIIGGLNNDWDRRVLREVYRDLNSLNSPFADKSDSFKVNVISDQSIFEDLPDFEEIKENALYFGHCVMDQDRITDFRYEFKPWASLSKIDNGRVKTINDLLDQELLLIDNDGNSIDLNVTGIGRIEFDILIYELSSEIFSYSTAERKSIRDYLKENGGVRVYRDGMRVYNYGENDNDWLGLDRRRINRFAGNVGNSMIIGSAKLSRSESVGLREKSNREGFIENTAYYAFENAVEYALSIIVRERNVDKQILTTLYKKHKVVEPVLSDLNEVIQLVEERIEDAEIKNEILKYLHRINSQYVEVKDILIKSANAGLNLSIVIHEVDKLMAQLTGSIEREERDKSISLSVQLEKIIRGYSAMIKKSDIRFTQLAKVVEIALDNFQFRFSDHRIEVISNWRTSALSAYLAESETISALTNLLDNSIFWLSYAKKENRKISVYITDEIEIESTKYHSIVVSDNGPGFNIPIDVAQKPFITGKPHNLGSGLGLHVVSEMIKSMKGRLLFLNHNDLNFPNYVIENKVYSTVIALCFPINK